MNEHEQKQNDVVAGLLVELERKHAAERLATRRLLVELMVGLGDDDARVGLIEMIGQHLAQMDDNR